MDKISIIIPFYSVEKYIEKCLDSIVNQTYKNLEIILVDDGSPDNCGAIAEEYAKKDSRIKVIHQKNAGLSCARNAGLKIATGDYVAFIDSDDYADVREYEVLHNLLVKYDVDIAFCGLKRFHEGEQVKNSESDFVCEKISSQEAMKRILIDNDIGNYVATKLFKRELFNDIEFPVNRAYEDVATIYKLISKVDSVAYTNEKLYNYLVGREGAITSTFSEKKIEDSMFAYYSQYKCLIEKYPEIKDYINLIYAKMYTSAMEKICLNNYDELYESDEVNNRYIDFKNAVNDIDINILKENLEDYRIISMTILNYNKNLYKELFDTIYKLKNQK